MSCLEESLAVNHFRQTKVRDLGHPFFRDKDVLCPKVHTLRVGLARASEL